jgi:glycine/D-amino acid oxidase-like deaminating enzyme/nitrite reductase/ring-hydroxylating ferredoxin subunit
MKVKSYPKLNSNIKTQVCIVGGGIAGYLTGLLLANQNFDVTILEANKIFQSTTVNTTAFITGLQGVIYKEIETKHGFEFAKAYFNSQQEGIDGIESLVKQYDIDCDFKRLPTYLFARKSTKSIKKEFEVLKKFNKDIKYIDYLEDLPLKIKGAIKLENQACFHPIKFLSSLPVNFNVFENSRVTEINFDLKEVVANNFVCKAEHIIIATHYPIFNFPELLFTKMYQSTSYCNALDEKTDIKGLYVEDIGNGLTFRNYNNQVIVGGFDHRTGRKQKLNPFDRLERSAKEVFKQAQTNFQWLAQDCMTFDYIPFASRIADYKNCYVITGFNKWGMANSFVSANLICDLVQEKKNVYEDVFSLNRVTMPNSPIKTAINFGETCKSLFKSFLVLPFKNYKKLKNNTGGIFLVNGKKCGVFRDENGNFHKVNSRCAHLNCELSFSNHTKTFDCVCHGSRYDSKGEILNEPTVKSIKIE